MAAPLPINESRRLDALRRYEILDTPHEQVFDDIALIASILCEVPIALVTLVDSERQWFKARVGIEGGETAREHAFCSYTILGDDVMVVEDATLDERFAANPLVTEAPNIRFYAGAPLIDSEGHALGSLCVVDTQPRVFSAEKCKALNALARQVIAQFEFRRMAAEMNELLADTRILRGLLPICSHCKGIRNEAGSWESLEVYMRGRTDADFSHGICPTCLKLHFPTMHDRMSGEKGN